MKELEFKDVSYTYSGSNHDSVKKMNFKINEGEFIVIVGPSGCYKTTTLRLLAGLETPTSGEILFDGEVINFKEPKDRDMALVFQDYALYPHFDVEKNLAFGLKNQNLSKKEIAYRVQDAGAKLGILNEFKKLPKNLSGGQQQRVALGRALTRDPSIYLFDEPLSNLDTKLRTKMRIELLKLHQKIKKTFIYVTHDQVEAMTLADRIIILDDGIIQQFDTPMNIFHKPKNLFIAEFIGYPEINTIRVKARNNKINMAGDIFDLPKRIAETHGNKDLVIAFRPDNTDYRFTKSAEFRLGAEILSKEILGTHAIFYCESICLKISVFVKMNQAIAAENKLFIKLDLDNCLYFDGVSELLIENI